MKPFKIINLKGYKWLNVAGLSVGIACVLSIMLWVEDEMKFDTFNKNANSIYRVIAEENGTGHPYSAMTMSPLAEALKVKIPEIEKAASFEMDWPIIVKVNENYYNEEGMAVVSKDFFDIFSFPFSEGDPQPMKTDKFSIALSEKLAKKYFNDGEAVGQIIEIKKTPVKVVAVFKNITYNSHIRFDLAVPEAFFGGPGTRWDNQSLYTYIMPYSGTNPRVIASKISDFLAKNINPDNHMKLALQPLKDIHFQEGFADEDYTYLGDKKYVYVFSMMGFFILVLACINYINLSTAASEKELKENGIRKILGASKSSLISKSLLKSLLTTTIATIIAVELVYLALPFINNNSQKSLEFTLTSPLHIILIIAVLLFAGAFSGLYPAFFLAASSPVVVKSPKATISQWHRKGIVVFQFSLSIILIIATLVSFKQLDYMRQINLGFDKENVCYFRIKPGKNDYQTLKDRLLKIPGIEEVGGKDYYSSTIYYTSSVSWPGSGPGITFSQNSIDEDFLSLLKVNFTDGNNFSKNLKSKWDNSVIINQQAKELLGVGNPIGKTLNFWGRKYNIIGVIDQTHFKSVNEIVRPEFYTYTYTPQYIFVRYNAQLPIAVNSLIKQIQATVKETYPETPFDFHFLDATYAHLYDNDKRVGSFFGIVAMIAILISCLGLFGLSKFSTENRVKEIGIRKVNGARISEILAMLNRNFVRWVVIAFVMACPVAYIAMNIWLENFTYKTRLSLWIFVLAGLLALVIALLTTSWQSWRAATKNPVEALRYE